MNKYAKYIFFILGILFIFGCSPSNEAPRKLLAEDENPAPRSSMSKIEAWQYGYHIASQAPGQRVVTYIANTGSMVPTMDSKSIVILELYTGQELFLNDIVLFDRIDTGNVLHRINGIKGNGLYIKGDGNNRADGWFDKKRVTHRVIGILYTSGK